MIFKGKEEPSIVPFAVPTSKDDSTSALVRYPNANALAANFVRFLHDIAVITEIPSPYGTDNPFLMVPNATISKNLDSSFYKRDMSMQDLVFSNDMVITIFKFLMQ